MRLVATYRSIECNVPLRFIVVFVVELKLGRYCKYIAKYHILLRAVKCKVKHNCIQYGVFVCQTFIQAVMYSSCLLFMLLIKSNEEGIEGLLYLISNICLPKNIEHRDKK